MTDIIRADAVGVAIGDLALLTPVSLAVPRGHALAVVGPNGSGKTTLLRVLAGRTRASSGSVTIDGHAPDDRRPAFRRQVAALLGVPPLARNLTLREHMVLVAASWGVGVDEAGRRSDALLDELELHRLASRFPHELSSGQTQLFTLALTLSRPCEVLLLDEPEQRLDPDRLALVSGVLQRVVAGGTTLVVASHSAPLVDQVADSTLPLTEAADDIRR
ncbi:glutamine transport ATP-binding protein GlnQ [mine drainage metagenome]|uniref:Glutamine transport ATP-binding protein GlnQ n=1 Tax=mine drainage metagenome TaxID=410659 RepID=A0A1J5QSG9_9ZZZZ